MRAWHRLRATASPGSDVWTFVQGTSGPFVQGAGGPRAPDARGCRRPRYDRALPQAPGHAAVPRVPDGLADGCPTCTNATGGRRLVQLPSFSWSRDPHAGLHLVRGHVTLN